MAESLRVLITKTKEVDPDAAAKLMSEFLEWMEQQHDFKITVPKAGKWGNTDDTWTWEDLARAYVADRLAADG